MKFKLITTNLEILITYILFLKKLKNIKNIKIVYLPSVIKKITLLKSPHVHKKSKEHFSLKKYSI